MNAQLPSPTTPLYLYSNDELIEMIRATIKKEKKMKKGKVVHKSNMITAKKFLKSQMVNKVCL